MAEATPEVEGAPEERPRSLEEEEEEEEEEIVATPDVNDAGMKIQRAKEVYKGYERLEEKPTKGEVLAWFFYELCSYFIHTILIPVLFPLIISQIMARLQDAPQVWGKNSRGFVCRTKEMKLHEGLTKPSIKVNNMKFSPLEWTSISWVIGLILAAPILTSISVPLDFGPNQQLIATAATAIGALFCLPTGAFKTSWIFPPYIAAIVAANTVCTAYHTRYLGLMVRGFIGSTVTKRHFPARRSVAGWLSLYSTAAGCLGSALISAFTYHMLKHTERFLSLWVVSIFSGLIWIAGILHIVAGNRPGPNTTFSSNSIPKSHVISIFSYPHAAGTLAGVFLSSFTTMCIFTGGVLYLVGQLCLTPANVLYLWLTYFLFPLLSLPLLQPLQQLIRADAVKMQLLGFLLSTFTSGIGFYHQREHWQTGHVLVLAAVQSVATGLLHAFGRVLLLDCSPAGKEGAFSAWFSWVRALGTCIGFAVASTGHGGSINKSFGVAFCAGIVGIVILIFGNISNFGGAVAAGHVREDGEEGSPARGLDIGVEVKAPEPVETNPYEGKMEAP